MALDSQSPSNQPSELLSTPSPVARAQSRIKQGRAETLAALENGGDLAESDAPVAEVPVVRVAPKEVAVPPIDSDDGDEVLAAARSGPVVDTFDPELSKRLAAIQAAEKRTRSQLAKEKSEFEAQRAEIQKMREAVDAERAEFEAYKKARERAKLDPVSYLEAAGVDDLEYAAKQAYAKAKTDPNNREAAARMLREREQAERIDALEKRLQERDRVEQERSQQENVRREADGYIAELKKQAAAKDLAPLAKHFLEKSPEKTDLRLRQIAVELISETGERPDFEDVLARYEQVRRAELEELGVDPSSFFTATKTEKPTIATAEKKVSAKTLGNDLSTPRVPRSRSGEREHRAETLKMLESGRLE